eukprot:76486_1
MDMVLQNMAMKTLYSGFLHTIQLIILQHYKQHSHNIPCIKILQHSTYGKLKISTYQHYQVTPIYYLLFTHLNMMCNLQPPFQSTIYSYYLIVPDDAKNVYFTTNPSENVRFIFDDPTYLLTEQETLEKKVNQIVSYNVGAFENVNSLKMEDIEKVMLSFYNENQIDNNTINKYMNISLFQWISEFVQDDTVHNLIETKYKNLSAKIESINNRETLDSDGLLHEPWTPITVDIHYDLHHYRIFVIRKSGEFDLKQFKKTMELNKNAYVEHSSRKCPDISIDAIVDSDIPEWWDRIRVWVVSCTVLIVMATYICYDRYSYFQLVKKHIPENQTKGG